MREKLNIWFPAKKYGYGWGLPCAWQGWIVMAAYFLLLILGVFGINHTEHMKRLAFIAGLSLLLYFICWLKGAKAAWRWGDTKKSSNQPSDRTC